MVSKDEVGKEREPCDAVHGGDGTPQCPHLSKQMTNCVLTVDLVFSKQRSWIPWLLAVTGHFPSYTWTFYRVEESGSRLMTRSPFFVLHFPVSICACLVCRPLIVNQLSSCMPASLSRPGLDQFIPLSRPTRQPSTQSFIFFNKEQCITRIAKTGYNLIDIYSTSHHTV